MATSKSSAESKKAVPPPSETVPMASPQIDNGFIWQQLNDINRGLGRIESSLDSLSNRVDKMESKVSDVKDKLNKILWVSIGGGAVIAAIISAVGAGLKYLGKI